MVPSCFGLSRSIKFCALTRSTQILTKCLLHLDWFSSVTRCNYTNYFNEFKMYKLFVIFCFTNLRLIAVIWLIRVSLKFILSLLVNQHIVMKHYWRKRKSRPFPAGFPVSRTHTCELCKVNSCRSRCKFGWNCSEVMLEVTETTRGLWTWVRVCGPC